MAFTDALCPKLQQTLLDVADRGAGFLTRQRTGFLDSLVSERNKAGFQQIEIANPNGGARVVEIVYIRPASSANISNTKQSTCAPGREIAPVADLIQPSTLSKKYVTSFEMSEEEVAKICFNSPAEYTASMIMGQFNALLTEINKDLLSQARVLFGNPYNTGVGPYTYVPPVVAINAPLLNGTTFAANPQGWTQHVQRRLLQLRVSGTPFAIGAGDAGLQAYADLLEIGCCNDSGIDVSKARGNMAYFYDLDADTIWGNNQFAVYMPGAFQLITYNEYGGTEDNPRRKRVEGYYEHDIITDPFTGLDLDFKSQYDPCTEKWLFTFGLNYKLWALPADMYVNTDPMFGVRNSLLFNATLA